MSRTYEDYKQEVRQDIVSKVQEMEHQPVLFAGAGLSIRYFGAPSWESLLREMASYGAVPRDFEYYKQEYEGDMALVGEEFVDLFREWAWEAEVRDTDEFEDWVYDGGVDADVYLKSKIAQHLGSLTPTGLEEVKEGYEEEIGQLRSIQPHAVITTNYDEFLNLVYPEYNTVVGQQVVESGYKFIGEVFQIHGSVSDPSSLVLTQEDLQEFKEKQKYLSAKLLTYFTEHPLIIVGYEPNDSNVQSILSDVKTVLPKQEFAENIYLINYNRDIPAEEYPPRDKIISIGDGQQMRVKYIEAESFDWIFEAFSEGGTLDGVNVKLLRKLMSNTYEIVHEEAPRKEINYETLEFSSDKDNLATLFGIAPEAGGTLGDGMASEIAEPGEDGLPVKEVLTADPAKEINEKLTTAVKNWTTNENLISERASFDELCVNRDELENTNRKMKFLFKSSIQNHSHGSIWLEQFTGDLDDLLRSTVEDDIGGRSLPPLERVLFILGKKEILDNIDQDPRYDYESSKAEYYGARCEMAMKEKLGEYISGSVQIYEEKYSLSELYDKETDEIVNLIDRVIMSHLEEDDSDHMRDLRACLRQLELIHLAQLVDRGDFTVSS